MTDIEAFRQDIITADPYTVAGNLLTIYSDEAAMSRQLGNSLLHPRVFPPGFSVSGSAGLLAPAGGGNTPAQIYNEVTMAQVGNPLTATSVIDVEMRRIDLPADWIVSVSPSQVTLDPGAPAAVTVTVMTGSLLPHSSGRLCQRPVARRRRHRTGRVPNYVYFDGKAHLYMPFAAY